MRWFIGIVVVVALAVLGYEYLWPQSVRPVAERGVQSARPAGETAGQPARTTSDQTATSDRTQALEDEVAIRSKQVAADAARRMQATADRVANAAQEVANSGAELEVAGTDVGKSVTDAVDEVTATLGGITDQASAQAAVPKLAGIDARLGVLSPEVAKLSGDARKTFAALVTGMLPKVESAIDRVQATPGASEAVKPALDPIRTKFDDWSHQPA